MKSLLTILVSLVLASCGTSGGSDTPATSAPVKTESKEPPISTSYYVNTAKDLRACDEQSKGFLAYVEDVGQFQACLSSGWTVVNVKGKDGANGKDGVNGSSASPMSINQWYDPITQKMWVMSTMNSSTTGWVNSQSVCTGNYRMPSPAEINTALFHGLKVAAQNLYNAPVNIIANDGNTYAIATGALNNTGSGAQFCISI